MLWYLLYTVSTIYRGLATLNEYQMQEIYKTYIVTKEVIGDTLSYGIVVETEKGPIYVRDVTTDHALIEKIVAHLRLYEVEPVHLFDVVSDMVTDVGTVYADQIMWDF